MTREAKTYIEMVRDVEDKLEELKEEVGVLPSRHMILHNLRSCITENNVGGNTITYVDVFDKTDNHGEDGGPSYKIDLIDALTHAYSEGVYKGFTERLMSVINRYESDESDDTLQEHWASLE